MIHGYDSNAKHGYDGTTLGQPEPGADRDIMRAFPDMSSRVSVAQEAAQASFKDLSDLMSRLGILNAYGVSGSKAGVEPQIGGEVDALIRQIDGLTDAVRDIRGLAETLNARL